jgi:uncharacterized OsmC-like protein
MKATTVTEKTTDKVNGVDVGKLFETIEAIKQTPGLATFKFRLDNEWMTCGHNRSTIKNFYGAGREDASRTEPFVLDADEPPVLLGTDKGANPVEYLLHALAACVTTSMVYHAEVESRVEGDIDLRGFLGLDESIPRGYSDIRIKFKIKADVPDERLEELVRLGPTFSPVFDTVTRPVNVSVTLDK